MAKIFDISGYRIFSAGAAGDAHVAAHRMLDLGRNRQGYQELGDWLAAHTGAGSDWIHLQWHMLVFELAVGKWEDAYDRCVEQVLPFATFTDEAATDAPAALWRLALTAPRPAAFPWHCLREGALRRLEDHSAERDEYVVLHDLLALAGAGDADNLSEWLSRYPVKTRNQRTLSRFARGFLSYSLGQYQGASEELKTALPGLPDVGGSRAQNELFTEIQRTAAARHVAVRAGMAVETLALAVGQ